MTDDLSLFTPAPAMTPVSFFFNVHPLTTCFYNNWFLSPPTTSKEICECHNCSDPPTIFFQIRDFSEEKMIEVQHDHAFAMNDSSAPLLELKQSASSIYRRDRTVLIAIRKTINQCWILY
jgi:hypothetical protein